MLKKITSVKKVLLVDQKIKKSLKKILFCFGEKKILRLFCFGESCCTLLKGVGMSKWSPLLEISCNPNRGVGLGFGHKRIFSDFP